VASSFARSSLFRRWEYEARYHQLAAMTSRPEYAAWAGVVPDDDPPDLVALARLQVLNTLLLAGSLHDRAGSVGLTVIGYEAAVLDPGAARNSLARVVPGAPDLAGSRNGGTAVADDTFSTAARKTNLTVCLSPADVDQVGAATAAALSAGRQGLPSPAWNLAREWAGGGYLYALEPHAAPPRPGRAPARRGQPCPVRWTAGHGGHGVLWRNVLVTNEEFAGFLNEMAGEGLPNILDGSYLLAVEKPRERGGRLHYNPHARKWTVSPGFGAHPAYWVTWTGAAAFAARHGARLPYRRELLAETSRDDLTVTNYGYMSGDTVAVTEQDRGPGEIHHLAGNVQV
jgi:hypothetical protein